jgi:hypothetical protein
VSGNDNAPPADATADLVSEIVRYQHAATKAARAAFPPGQVGSVAPIVAEARLTELEGLIASMSAQMQAAIADPSGPPPDINALALTALRDYWKGIPERVVEMVGEAKQIVQALGPIPTPRPGRR